MPIAQLNGIKLYYEEHGTGYPVVFLHAFGTTTYMWRPQIPAFSEKYRFIIYDARGHGQTESPASAEQYSAEIVVDDLYQLFRHLRISKAVLGGLSIGGLQVLRFAIRHPEMVAALVLMSTGPGYRDKEHMAEWNKKQDEHARMLETKGMAAFAGDPVARNTNVFLTRELLLKQNPVGLAHMARTVLGQHDTVVIEHLSKLKLPTLVVAGENDAPYIPASKYMAKAIPGAKLVTIPNAGHAANIENTPAFNGAVLGFLEGLHLKTGKE